MRSGRFLVAMAVFSVAWTSHAQTGPVCLNPPEVGLERHLRQLMLDLLGRPPTIAEYRRIQGEGTVRPELIREMMQQDEFYARMKTYHRTLLKANASAAIFNNNDTRIQTTTDGNRPLETRGNASAALRGRNGQGCDHFIQQDDCNNNRQDPHAEPAVKTCRDANGVPLPVSFDYDNTLYSCTQLAATDCNAAVTAALIPDKHLYFCDMRRLTTGLAPHLCLPSTTNLNTAGLTQEVLDVSSRVVAFVNPAPASGNVARLDRCTLDLRLRNNVRGSYQVQQGCFQREGTVMVQAPFWDTSGVTQVAACAIEAQARPVNPVTMESCETSRFMADRSCGCGVGFRRCEAGNGSTHTLRVNAINEEPLLITDSVLRRDEDYFNILTTRRGFVNGPLSALYRENQATGVLAITAPADAQVIPARSFTEDPTQWSEYIRDANNSGVLTTPLFLYRFPTVRSRVNHFYEAFLCKHFSPPADATLPPPEDSCNRENNLAKRCGCNYCHATIEPAGAHWGRYGERNAQFLNPLKFPRYDARCRDCALAGNTTCDGDCANYVMQAYDGDGANSLGLLRTYLYRTDEEEPNISGGPRLLVDRMMQTGDLERCAVKNVWGSFLGRPMTTLEQDMYLEDLSRDFASQNHNFKKLIEAVLSTDAYRRID
jgi:hypothetical protein